MTAQDVNRDRVAATCAAAALVVLTAVSGAACRDRSRPATPSEAPPIRVTVATVRLRPLPEIYEAVGTVRAKVAATVAPKVMALVEKVHVQPGDQVTAGQVLASLDDRELKAQFDRARSDYERYRALVARQAVTQAEFDAVLSRYRVAEAALSHALVEAPFDGIVADKFVDAGDMAVPGKPMFTIEQQGTLRLEAMVPERLQEKVKLGQRVGVAIDATGEVCPGTIGELVPAADAASRSFRIKIDLACKRPLQSGTFGRARLRVGVHRGISVPARAVHRRGQITFVYIVEDEHVQMRLVKIGRAYGNLIEVLAGLSAGAPVVVAAAEELVDGRAVESTPVRGREPRG